MEPVDPTKPDLESLRREHYNATAVEVRRPNDDLMILRVRPDAPIPPYEAGQWISIGLGLWEDRCDGCPPENVAPADRSKMAKRPYSISSPILRPDGSRLLSPEEEDSYELYLVLLRDVEPGMRFPVLTPCLFAVEPGRRLFAGGHPHGHYTLANVSPEDDVLFAATGTGEAPHNRMIWELLRRGHRGRIGSVLTTRRRADQAYRAVHERLMQMFPNYRYFAVSTREPDEEAMRLQVMLQIGALEERIGFALDPRRARVFLCGNPAMIGAPRVHGGKLTYPEVPGMVELLERLRGFRANPPSEAINIHYERFW